MASSHCCELRAAAAPGEMELVKLMNRVQVCLIYLSGVNYGNGFALYIFTECILNNEALY